MPLQKNPQTELRRIADLLERQARPKPKPPLWKRLPYKDLTIITGLIVFLFTVRTEIGKMRESGNRGAVSEAVVKSIEMINEDIVFRGIYNEKVSQVRNQLLDQARLQTPNDPFVITLALFSRLVDLTRDPMPDDGPEILALARYPANIDPLSVHASPTSMKMYSKWLNISGAALLNLLVKNPEVRASRQLAATYYEVAYASLTKSVEYTQDPRERLQTYSLLAQHHIRGKLYQLPAKDGVEELLTKADAVVNAMGASERPADRVTSVDATANLLHLRGQIKHVAGDHPGATAHYESALQAYERVKTLYPARYNAVEVDLVMHRLENARLKLALNAR